MSEIVRDRQYIKFSLYGFLKNLRFFDAFIILFLVEQGTPYTQIGVLYAVREIIINVLELPSGIIADTLGRKSALAASLFIYIISFCIFYFSHNFWLLLAAFSIYGIADAFRSGTHKGMIMDYLELTGQGRQKISYYGHTRSWAQAGSALSSLIAGSIVFYSADYRSIFIYSIIPYFLNFLLILTYPGSLNYSRKTPENKSSEGFIITVKSFFRTIREPGVLRLLNTSALHSAYLKAVKDYIQPLMVSIALILPVLNGIDQEKKNGLVIGLIYFFIYLLTSRASKVSYRYARGKRENIPLISLIIGFGLGLACGLASVLELWLISLLFFVGIFIIENIRKPILTGFVADRVPNDILASVLSAQSLLKTIITAFLALLFGVLADLYSIGISFIAVSLFLVITTLALNILVKVFQR